MLLGILKGVSKRGVLLIRQIFEAVFDGGSTILLVPRPVLAIQEEAHNLRDEEAEREADHDTGETLVVPGSEFAVSWDSMSVKSGPLFRFRCADRYDARRTGPGSAEERDLRIKEQGTRDVAQRISDESSRGIDGLLGVASGVGRSQANALNPGRREEVDEVEAEDLAHQPCCCPVASYRIRVSTEHSSAVEPRNLHQAAAQDDRQAERR